MPSTRQGSMLGAATGTWRPRATSAEPQQTISLKARPHDPSEQARREGPADRRERWPDRRIKTKVFLTSLVLNLAAALVLAYRWEIGHSDGLSRTANAWYVLYSRDPHLAAIGFVWPVLPSLVQLPLLPLARLVGHPEIAGFVMSALAGAGVLAVLAAVLGALGITGWTRLFWLAAVQLHPQFWYLAAIGVAEQPFTFFICLAVLAFLRLPERDMALAGLGISLAVAFYVRYEALGYLAGFALLTLLLPPRGLAASAERRGSPRSVRECLRTPLCEAWHRLRSHWELLEGRFLVVIAPSAYGVLLWVLMNWLIMGDPLYFQRSVFSLNSAYDVARNAGPSHPLYALIGSVPLTAEYAIKRLTEVHVALPVLTLFAIWTSWTRREWRLLGLVGLVASAVAFTSAQVFVGTLPNYLRYWSFATPFAVILAAGCVHACRHAPQRRLNVLRQCCAALLVLGVLLNVVALGEETVSVDEQRLGAELRGDHRRAEERATVDSWWIRHYDAALLAPVLNELSADGLTLIDIETAYHTIVRVQHPERLVIASDRDFDTILKNPQHYLRYIVISDPASGGARDLVNQHYPGLFEGQVPWVRLVREVTGTIQPWRIYEITTNDTSGRSTE
jgi:hypothetical protein